MFVITENILKRPVYEPEKDEVRDNLGNVRRNEEITW